MTDHFDFDTIINRQHTDSFKYSGRQALFGRSNIIPMWVADMDFASPPAVSKALSDRAAHPIYGYSDFPESLYRALIAWFKKRHQWEIQREWIMMSPGVVPSLHAAALAFAQVNEAIIVQPPVYFPFFSAVKNTGRTLIENTLVLKNNRYEIDFVHLESCAKHARMLLLCSPHNPVGRVWEKAALERIVNIAEKYNLVIFSDEIHADLTYTGARHYPLASIAPASNRIVTAVAPSKTFNIAGLNLSALIVPNQAHRQALHAAFETLHVSATNPFSIVAFEAAYRDGEAWLDALLPYLTKTRDFVIDYVNTHLPKMRVIDTDGTYLLWLDCRALAMDDDGLKQFFIEKASLGLSPGILFGAAGGGFMRMNIAAPLATIRQALDQINKALN